jgi:predicted peroxiredoxin
MTKLNYTPEMLAVIKGYDAFNKATATEIAAKIGKSPRSVIAKIKSMGLSYTVQRPVRKDGSPVSRKAETVAAIAKALDMDLNDLDGLAKAPRSALIALLREIP